MSESDEEGLSSTKKPTLALIAQPIAQPAAQPPPQANPWQYLQMEAANVNGNIGPKAWACTFRAQYEENAQMTNINMCNLIALIIGEAAASSLLISTSSAEGELYKHLLQHPYNFLILGVPQSAITRLTGLGVCSSPDITCFFISYNQPLPKYICTLKHFIFPDCKGNSPPNLSLKDYFEWSNLIQDLQFTLEDYGTSLVHSKDHQFLCTGCKSYDHPMGLCPFLKILGWFGLATSTNDNTSNVSLDNRVHTSQNPRGNPNWRGRGLVGRGQGCRKRGQGQY
ncbi:hypothetical protein BDR06DRAFT_971545 [Suillus hirtellus]|nr:hypothetical protein BDR06DRAFT_971545 [Suillus hirtellus]